MCGAAARVGARELKFWATHGFVRAEGPILPVDAVHFAIGAGFTTSRKRVENVTALKLSALAKSTLQNSVSDFLTRA